MGKLSRRANCSTLGKHIASQLGIGYIPVAWNRDGSITMPGELVAPLREVPARHQSV